MIFADKLIQLRKKAGWSQEDLADRVDVTRQSVSKWEGGQSIPDIDKLIRLSELFNVSTDYLLKDEIGENGHGSVTVSDTTAIRHVSMDETNTFLSIKNKTSKYIAVATLLCILSPICLMLLSTLSETPEYGIKENVAAGIGMTILLFLVASAVGLFIYSGRKSAEYNFLDTETIKLDKAVSEMVVDLKNKYNTSYTKNNIIGAVFCVLAAVPLFIGILFNEENAVLLISMVAATICLAGIGVTFFVITGIRWASYEKLLQEGDYSKEKKKHQAIITSISAAYWLITTAIYLGYSFATNNWENSWIIWAVAGVLYPVINLICNLIIKKK